MNDILLRLTLVFFLSSLGMMAYADPGDGLRGGGQTLRAEHQGPAFWNWRPNDPGNGDVDLGDDHDDDGLPDTIIWCIGGDGTGTDVMDPTGRLIVYTVENQIYDADGVLQCTASKEGGLVKLREGLDGEVILTATLGRFVFAGDLERPPVRASKAWRQLARTHLLYEFYGNEVYDGWRLLSGDVLTTATERIFTANPMRKLLIAALLSGACGVHAPR
jgi:hypothetical protein